MLLRGSGVLALYSGLLYLLWVLVAGIALFTQPVSESASLLPGNQLRHIHTHIFASLLRGCSAFCGLWLLE